MFATRKVIVPTLDCAWPSAATHEIVSVPYQLVLGRYVQPVLDRKVMVPFVGGVTSSYVSGSPSTSVADRSKSRDVSSASVKVLFGVTRTGASLTDVIVIETAAGLL